MTDDLIKKANNCVNILNEITIEVLTVNGKEVNIQCSNSSELSPDLIKVFLQLTEDNMKELYERSSWGWNRGTKLKEFQHKNARFVTLFLDETMIGFVHLRFEHGSDESEACVYCYELQIVDEFQRKGLGTYLMNILMLLAVRFKMYKVMLTVFKYNSNAIDFYMNKAKFRIDKSSPSKFDEETEYEILSLKISKRKKK